ncbi:DASH complex subunit Dam1-domain-containing protein [Ampelomyces quisqualis]|uniref:DASH complex subunit DAM1 n=1 Tax=Ampelomyces quisqualis TaxID=50730 RepID=A0A6A5R0P9_AMPQU|nr:DASH complex subunit Dam1-domain-containing protein [Ampelomyces quisqualis]
MASTTPTRDPPSHRQQTRSKSPRSRPTTPLRPSSRSSLRDSVQRGRCAASSGNALEGLQDGFAELSDAMADLEQNFMQLQLMHESLARFSESFAGFLYGMNMNAFCVDFPEAPIAESFKRPQNHPDLGSANLNRSQGPDDLEATFLTTDTSFVENPPSSKASSKFQTPQTPAPASKTSGIGRGRGGIPRAGRGGGIPTRGGATRGSRGGSGIARGSAGRGRGARS